MIKNRQAEIIQKISKKELILNLYITQFLFLFLSLLLSYLFYDNAMYFTKFLVIDSIQIVFFGVGSAAVIIIVDLFLWKLLPNNWTDDGGINEKIFTSLSVVQILMVTLMISVCEELLFRGSLQPKIGLFWTSIGFALMHVRYLNKIVLITSALTVSFYLGWLFEITQNLYVTIIAHFFIDFILGLLLHFQPFKFLRYKNSKPHVDD
jgi:membrane protease YdiL (CAAX protease family)